MKSEEKEKIYEGAREYWKSITASDSGMLGGFPNLSQIDTRDSKRLIKFLVDKHGLECNVALDCGSGIGRVTKFTLLPFFRVVDMTDVTDSFLDASNKYLGQQLKDRIERKICVGLESLEPEPNRYDLIWIQWVSGHLTDEDFVTFFQRCRRGLKNNDNSFMVLKENVCSPTIEKNFDETDKSWTRSEALILSLFEKAGLKVIAKRKQKHFPEGMYSVISFALC